MPEAALSCILVSRRPLKVLPEKVRKEHPFHVEDVASLSEAQKELASGNHCLVLLDKKVVGEDIAGAVRACRDAKAEVPAVVVVDKVEPQTYKDAIAQGAFEVIGLDENVELALQRSIGHAIEELSSRHDRLVREGEIKTLLENVGGKNADLEELSRELHKMVVDMDNALKLSQTISTLSLESQELGTLTELLQKTFRCCAWGIMLSEGDKCRLELFVARNPHIENINSMRAIALDAYRSLEGTEPADENLTFNIYEGPAVDRCTNRCKLQIFTPLIVRGRNVGMSFLFSCRTDFYSDDKMRMFTTICNQLAASLENASLFQEVKRLSITDDLTGIYNRRHLNDQLRYEIYRAKRYGYFLSCMMIDIDHFKQVNDQYGHTVGDEALRQMARQLSHNIRKTDFVGRYGGEEFTVILPGVHLEGAYALAKKIRERVEKHDFQVDGILMKMTISIGVAQYNKHSCRTHDDLIKWSDKALYAAKEAGRNTVFKYERNLMP